MPRALRTDAALAACRDCRSQVDNRQSRSGDLVKRQADIALATMRHRLPDHYRTDAALAS
jgi:hypothetical protein